MTAVRPLAMGMVVWAALATFVRADPITRTESFNWVAYFAGQNGNNGGMKFALASSPMPAAQPIAAPMATLAAVPAQTETASAPTTPISIIANAPVAQPVPTPLPVSVPSVSVPSVSAPPVSSAPVDAFINLGSGGYPLQGSITTGGASPWYSSSQITGLFGSQPTAQQIQSFDSTILQRVQQTFSQSGVSVSLTENPNTAALHTISLVSNTESASLKSAIGMTQVGASGFSFIDKIAPSAQSVDQLEWIVAHNISHELMLAFGVPESYDQTGAYVDSEVASWAMMVNPSATFSPAAAQAIAQALSTQNTAGSANSLGAQELPAPEPAAIALWTLAGTAALVIRHVRGRKSQTIA